MKWFKKLFRRRQRTIGADDILKAMDDKHRSPDLFTNRMPKGSHAAIKAELKQRGVTLRVKTFPLKMWKKSSTVLHPKWIALTDGFYESKTYVQAATLWHEAVHVRQRIRYWKYIWNPVYRWTIEMPAHSEMVAAHIVMGVDEDDVESLVRLIAARMWESYGLFRIDEKEVHDQTKRILLAQMKVAQMKIEEKA